MAFNIAEANRNLSRYEEANKWYGVCVELKYFQFTPEVYFYRGNMLKMMGDFPNALKMYEFYKKIESAYESNANDEQLKELLGRGRAKKGMFEGDLVEGELEIGQVSAMIRQIVPAGPLTKSLWDDCQATLKHMASLTT